MMGRSDLFSRWRMVVVASVFATSVVVTATTAQVWASPPPANSWYIRTIDSNTSYTNGCNLGSQVQSLPGTQSPVVFLHFGAPVQLAGGAYGATFYRAGSGAGYGSLTIIAMAQEFAHGYWICSGSDTSSLLKLAIGTSNDGNLMTNSSLAAAHGAAWASFAVTLKNNLANLSASHYQTLVYAESDLEPISLNPDGSTSFHSFADTKPWLDGYNGYSGRLAFWAGAACFASTTGPYVSGTSCGTGWTVDNMQYAVWRLGLNRPLPQIYHTSAADATRWQLLSKYSVTAYGSRFVFVGALSQMLACQQTGGCPGADNTPDQAWSQLQYLVNSDPATTTTIPAVTDIGNMY